MPVPVDLVANGCTPALDSLERAITPATRAVVIAHLFGTRIDMEPILDIARRHRLFVIEDCAQAYHGAEYLGHPESDAVLFSFGPIKTATALGGGLMYVRNRKLADQIRGIQAAYPVQIAGPILCRVLRYAGMKWLSHPLLFRGVTVACRMCGVSIRTRSSAVQAQTSPAQRLFEHLRRQPSVPLLRMMQRRLHTYPLDRIGTQTQRGNSAGRTSRSRAAVAPTTAASPTPPGSFRFWPTIHPGSSNGSGRQNSMRPAARVWRSSSHLRIGRSWSRSTWSDCSRNWSSCPGIPIFPRELSNA